ncbi:MAG: DNA-directed RNA polymerase subunit P [archaeon]
MAWVCILCGKKTQNISQVKCPNCGGKMLLKERPPVVRKIKTD